TLPFRKGSTQGRRAEGCLSCRRQGRPRDRERAGPVAASPGHPLPWSGSCRRAAQTCSGPFRRRGPADSAVGSFAPPGSHAAPPALVKAETVPTSFLPTYSIYLIIV